MIIGVDAGTSVVKAVAFADDMLSKHGMQSNEFRDADHAAGVISMEIQRLLGYRNWLG